MRTLTPNPNPTPTPTPTQPLRLPVPVPVPLRLPLTRRGAPPVSAPTTVRPQASPRWRMASYGTRATILPYPYPHLYPYPCSGLASYAEMLRVASDLWRPCHSRPCARSARESGRCLGTAECWESGRGTSGVESIVCESEV